MAQTQNLDQRFADAMGALLGPDFPSDLALAVSGGGDSMAMLTLAHNWTHRWGVRLWVVTIDHGLRPEAGEEAAMVAAECAALGHSHHTLRWTFDGVGNVQARAREARLTLIDQWRGGVEHVLMAHSQDDVAETFLMRLERGAGVDGLASMSSRRTVTGIADEVGEIIGDGPLPPRAEQYAERSPMQIIRPCLEFSRAELRHYLTTLHGVWVEDPSNEDPKFDRVRVRRLLSEMEETGFATAWFASAAKRMTRARKALLARAASVWDQIGAQTPAGLEFNRAMAEIEDDTALRLISYGCRYISGNAYAPRESVVEQAWEVARVGGTITLHGCVVHTSRDRIALYREFNAVKSLKITATKGAIWDDAWQVTTAKFEGCTVRALGEDGWGQLSQIQREQRKGVPKHAAALAQPSIWDGEKLVVCPAFEVGQDGDVALHRCDIGFKAFLLSH
ncbi:MAG: tRNA lysidine(34) synthetase TilS [Marinovum sp.]|nr:tRNA lysidine(34) synthetase TilS [Marinovum sp.]